MSVSAPLTKTPFNFPNNYFQASIKIYQWKKLCLQLCDKSVQNSQNKYTKKSFSQ